MSTYGDGSDGELNFTTSTKSYGNLVLDTDYKVSGNTLYLKVDTIYNFTNFTLGSGTELRPWASSNQGTSLYIKCNGTATISGTVRASFQYAFTAVRGNGVTTSWATGESEGTLNTPGVASGGSGNSSGSTTFTSRNNNYGSQSDGFGGGGAGGKTFNGGSNTESGGNGGNGKVYVGGDYVSVSRSTTGYSGLSGNNASGNSLKGGGGGGGAVSVYLVETFDGGNTAGANGYGEGGTGTETNGGNGSDGIAYENSSYSSTTAAGGGGAGGGAGYSGINFILKATTISFNGTINTSGTSGGNGGAGGRGNAWMGADIIQTAEAQGGGGGGGGGGGSAGNITFTYASSLSDTGSKTLAAGSGGSGGTGGVSESTTNSASNGYNGASGSNGSSGSYSELQKAQLKINIEDLWKDVTGSKINIEDSWKIINGLKINIGDNWKTIM